MKSTKSYKIVSAAALTLTLGLTPVFSLLPGSAPSAFAAEAQKVKAATSWDLELTNAPFKKNGVLFVPLKELSEYLDLQITQSSDKKFIYISSPSQSVRVAPGQSKAVNAKGTAIILEAAPVVRKGVTYAPSTLLTKSFGIPVKWNNTSIISIQGNQRQYASAAAGSTLFWLNRETKKLSMGQAGSLPKAAGKIMIKDVDWLSLKPRKVSASSYVVDIENHYGEPHIHETHVRALLNNGIIVKQGLTHFSNFAGINTKPDVNGYKGNVAIMNGSTLQLVHPTGKVTKTYDLAAITGEQDDFIVEVIEADFLLVRPYKKATLYIVHPTSKKSVLIYPELLDEEAQKSIADYPANEAGYVGDSLTLTVYKNKTLTFEWNSPMLGKHKTFTYKLPF